ncbi:MAG: hypothetical protein R3C26_07720 [Calditrichia bacterium]
MSVFATVIFRVDSIFWMCWTPSGTLLNPRDRYLHALRELHETAVHLGD